MRFPLMGGDVQVAPVPALNAVNKIREGLCEAIGNSTQGIVCITDYCESLYELYLIAGRIDVHDPFFHLVNGR